MSFWISENARLLKQVNHSFIDTSDFVNISIYEDELREEFITNAIFSNINILKEKIYFDNFIKVLGNLFLEFMHSKVAKPIFIPSFGKIDVADNMYIDVFYSPEDVNFVELEYLTDDGEIGKSIIFSEVYESDSLCISFKSLIYKNENQHVGFIGEFANFSVYNNLYKNILFFL